MTKEQRSRWYRVAGSMPLSQRHAGHILSRLKTDDSHDRTRREEGDDRDDAGGR
jgi:hypothetical protein